jgi:hypothetical protein
VQLGAQRVALLDRAAVLRLGLGGGGGGGAGAEEGEGGVTTRIEYILAVRVGMDWPWLPPPPTVNPSQTRVNPPG